jgi:hypothetical protein
MPGSLDSVGPEPPSVGGTFFAGFVDALAGAALDGPVGVALVVDCADFEPAVPRAIPVPAERVVLVPAFFPAAAPRAGAGSCGGVRAGAASEAVERESAPGIGGRDWAVERGRIGDDMDTSARMIEKAAIPVPPPQ